MRSPLAEVFGYPYSTLSRRATQVREHTSCPFKVRGSQCIKDKKDDPLGVCSIHHEGAPIITCPVQFEKDRVVFRDASAFFFGTAENVEVIPEARLRTSDGTSAGNIDFVPARMREGEIVDFGALEIQLVYISGNVREPFERYMKDPRAWNRVDWNQDSAKRPRPDYLSSSQKRLVPQIIQKGRILGAWCKKQAVAIQSEFYATLPSVERVPQRESNLAWLIYDLQPADDVLVLQHQTTVYTTYGT